MSSKIKKKKKKKKKKKIYLLFLIYGSGQRSRKGRTVWGLNSGWDEIFLTDRPWGPPSLLYNGYWVTFPGVKRLRRGADHQTISSAEVKERVELYPSSPLGLHGQF